MYLIFIPCISLKCYIVVLSAISYPAAVPIPTSQRYNTPVLLPSVFEHRDVLRVLSQNLENHLPNALGADVLFESSE
jgi:hypothetical protein